MPRCAVHGLFIKKLPASIGGARLYKCKKCVGPLILSKR